MVRKRMQGCSSVQMQSDLHKCFFLNWMIADYETRAPRLDDSDGRCRARSKYANAWRSTVQVGSWISTSTSKEVGVEVKHPVTILHSAL